MSDTLYYRFYQRMDEPTKIVGIPIVEFFIAVGLAAFCMLKGHLFVGLLLGIGFLAGVRSLRQGKGRKWLTALAYWYLPEFVLPMIFWSPLKVTPPSYKRLWLS